MDKISQPDLLMLWRQAVSPLRDRLSTEDFRAWIEPMTPVALREGEIEIAVPNRLFAGWIQENFLDDLTAAWVAAAGRQASFRFTYDGNVSPQGELFDPDQTGAGGAPQLGLFNTRTSSGQRQTTDAKTRGGLIQRYGFNSFVVGTSNQFARAAAMAVAGQPGTLYNPYFVFGGVGLGKTHLVNAIGNAIVEREPNMRVHFMSADNFTNRLIDSIARNRVREFKQRMRKIDVLILDDVQFLAGRERTQEEFFHIFNTLYDGAKQIILTSDKFPNEIQGLEQRLCNRFGWGLVADIQSPDVETRVAIVERKARDEGISLPIDVAKFIASRIDSNIRDLEGALTRLSAWSSIHQCEISMELAQQLLGSGLAEDPGRPTAEQIEARVTSHFGLRPGDLKARRRTRKVAEARHVAMYMMRNHGGMSFPSIGDFLGGRDHSTVVHGCRAVEKRCSEDPSYRAMISTLLRLLGSG